MIDESPLEPGLEESPLSRRTHSRLQTKLKIHYKLVKSGDKLVRFDTVQQDFDDFSSTKDISVSGISFFSDKLIPTGSVLQLKVEMPDDDKPIDCLARVERTEEIMKDKIYAIGVYYLDLSRENRLRVDKYVTSKGQEIR